MKVFPLRSNAVSLAVTETGGHLSDVVFSPGGGRAISPMHTAPWRPDELGDDTPPSRGSAVPKAGSKEKADKKPGDKPDTGGMEPQPQG